MPSSPRRRAPVVGVEHLDAGSPRRARPRRRPPCRPRTGSARPRPRARRRWPGTRTRPRRSTESSIGPVKNSPSGMLCSPTHGMNLRPATPSVMSVPGPVMWTSSLPSIQGGQALDLVRLALPGGQRLGVRGQTGLVIEVLVGRQRHPRLSRVGVRREEREQPAVFRPRRPSASCSSRATACGPSDAIAWRCGSTCERARGFSSAITLDANVGVLRGPHRRSGGSTRAA